MDLEVGYKSRDHVSRPNVRIAGSPVFTTAMIVSKKYNSSVGYFCQVCCMQAALGERLWLVLYHVTGLATVIYLPR